MSRTVSGIDNAAIARELALMADLLEISGADRFRSLSYRSAAGQVRSWPEPLSEMAAEGRLTEIPGVGKKLAASIADLVLHGTFPDLEALTDQIPAGVVELVGVNGVGPSRARRFFEELGIDSVDALAAALDDGSVTRLGGIGEKTAEAIGRGVEAYLAHRGSVLLMDALPLAESLAEEIAELDEVASAFVAGEVRRACETVDRVVVVAAAPDTAAALAAIERAGIAGAGADIDAARAALSFATPIGITAEVRLCDPAVLGSTLAEATGSEQHLARLAALAAEGGLVFPAEGGAAAAGGASARSLRAASEEKLYGLLGLAEVPPPELREDTGEIEAARAGTLPRLLEPGDIRGDLHAHTTSTDAHSTLEENRAMAARLGYDYVAVTDHAYDLRMVRGLDVVALEAQWAEVDRLNADGSGLPRILKGIELNIGSEGRVDYPDEVLARFDFCIASLHGGWHESAERVTARLLAAIENPFVDIIGHPTGRILGRREPLPLDLDAVFEAAARTGTLLELNAYPDRLDLSAAHLARAREAGVRFAIGTDAHRAGHLLHMRYGVLTARRGWVRPEEVVNTLGPDELLSALKRNRSR